MSLEVGAAPVGTTSRLLTATGRAARSAVARDLNRLTTVLAEPTTAVRRAALVAHIGFLADQARDDLDGAAAVALSRLRHEARCWGRDPAQREAVHAAAIRASALVPEFDPPRDGEPDAGRPRSPVRLARLLTVRSPALAYRYFWMLDGLSTEVAGSVTGGFSRAARWALRNLFSGGYNRRAHLLWVGGGSGPAV